MNEPSSPGQLPNPKPPLQQNPMEKGRPVTKETPDANVYEPESLKKARQITGLTDEQARRAQRRNKGTPVW
jgi:hypothetical protein